MPKVHYAILFASTS